MAAIVAQSQHLGRADAGALAGFIVLRSVRVVCYRFRVWRTNKSRFLSFMLSCELSMFDVYVLQRGAKQTVNTLIISIKVGEKT